jgi:hypothetical protein
LSPAVHFNNFNRSCHVNRLAYSILFLNIN